ncbi:MAG: ATP-binding cassette domain-containing protein [Akkermansiaceae bacterium]
MGFGRNILRSAKRLVFRDSLEARHERTSKALLEVFSSFIVHDGQAVPRELEIVFDFVRSIFPAVDHGILGRSLENAVSNPVPIEPALLHLKKSLPAEQKAAFALQLYSVVRAGGDVPEERERFIEVMSKLGHQALGEAVIDELSSTSAKINKHLIRVDFAADNKGDVRLTPGDSNYRFRCYRAGGLILIRNLSETPFWIRGHSLDQDRLLQIRANDEVLVNQWRLVYSDLVHFLQIAEKGNVPDLFLVEEEGELTLSRSKSRLALARLSFGHRVVLTPLQDGVLTAPNRHPLEKNLPGTFDYHELIHFGKKEPVSLESLRRLSMQTGQRFVLPAGRRKVIVSNDPSQLSGDSLLLTPGLASRFVLELEFDPGTGMGEIHVKESAQTILANGLPVRSAPLLDGSLIRLSSRQALRCRFSENVLDEERNLVRQLVVENLNHSFWKGGKAIDSLSFEINRGEMLCIIGPSGSGKSTLLEILAGQRKPQSGHVRLNGLSLYERQHRLSPLISFMPQEDALSAQLTTREHLAHACAIRRPHLSEDTIQKRVSYLLGELGLDRIGERRVGSPDSKSLSGGERSRLNAGLDLIGGGEVFLFDEPISGLSSKDAEHVVQSLHGLAKDKIVVASLHRPSEKVLEAFDQVLLLDRGGKMAFYGPPDEIVQYFESAANDLAVYHDENSLHRGADFVFDVLEAPLIQLNTTSRLQRRFPPEFWQERFENHRVMAHLTRSGQGPTTGAGELPTADDQVPAPEPPSHGRRQKWMIFKTHLARAVKSKFRYRGTFYSILLEAPLLALLIGQTLRASAEGSYQFHSGLHLPSYLFLAVTVAMFFGLTNSATEVLRDRPILRRERNCRPHPILYLGSKFLVLSVLVTLQSAVFIACAHWLLDLRGMFWDHLFWMVLTGCCGTSISLLISVMARSERTALSSIPLILVPQILLAGALIPFSEMNRGLFKGGAEGRAAGSEPVPSTIMPLRYAFEGAIISQATRNHFELRRRPLQEQIDYYKEMESLTDQDQKLLSEARESLSILYVATTDKISEARKIIANPLAEKERLMAIEEEDEEAIPVSDFFVNKRVENLVDLAEASRLDDRRDYEPHVFLAEKKPVFGVMTGTIWYCTFFLVLITVVTVGLATYLLRISLNKS